MKQFLELRTDCQIKGLRMTTAKWVLNIACEGEEPITVAHNRVKGEHYGHGDQPFASIKGGIF
jgi:hypothetical protein